MAQYERQYETTIVLDSFLKGDEIKNLVAKIQSFIKNNGGTVDNLEEWGKKRLAYEINRKQYGNYVYVLFTGPSTLPELLEREYRLEEAVIRYLTLVADPRALAERNASKTTAPSSREAGKGESKPAKAEEVTPSAEGEKADAAEVKKAEAAEVKKDEIEPEEVEKKEEATVSE